MKYLTDIEYVKTLKANLRGSLETPDGELVMQFLESLCGWYDFEETDKDIILIKHGKRQVLATIKTLINSTPEQIVAMTKGE